MNDEGEDPRHDPAAALAAIKAAHAAGGRALSAADTIAFILRPIYMGLPKAPEKAPGKRGPKHRKTQYDRAADRRRNPLRTLVKLPAMNRAVGWEARPEYVAMLHAVLADKAIHPRHRVRELLARRARLGLEAPSERSASRHLALAKKGHPIN